MSRGELGIVVRLGLILLIVGVWLPRASAQTPGRMVEKDIRSLSHHFNAPGGDISPWIFVPDDNVKELSTSDSPGLVTVWEAGRGKDVKGILKEPIRLDQYPLPWEFQLGLVQNFEVLVGMSSAAAGINVAVTFSDPSTWPKDRTQMPPNTHSVQLLAAHLANLPQYATNPWSLSSFIWGRGDLSHVLTGNWNIQAVWAGDGSENSGPASNEIFFRFVVRGARKGGTNEAISDVYSAPETAMALGVKFNASNGWHMRNFDCSRYGKATGIWQIGPIFSCDRWIPDGLAANVPRTRGPAAISVGSSDPKVSPGSARAAVHSPEPQPPDPNREYYVNYCVFMRSRPIPFEHLSDDFNILGYLGRWVDQPQSTVMDTYTHPGYLTWTLMGPAQGTGIAPVGGDLFNLDLYPPPWEMEICFEAPDDSVPWNFWMNFQPVTSGGRRLAWHPGVQNLPKEKKHVYLGDWRASQGKIPSGTLPARGANAFDVKFDPPVPESILSRKPLYMLLQWIDKTHVRVGFKAKPGDSWYLSQIYDCAEILNGEEFKGNFMQADWSTTTGRRRTGMGGSPMYKQILINYIHYRYGLTAR